MIILKNTKIKNAIIFLACLMLAIIPIFLTASTSGRSIYGNEKVEKRILEVFEAGNDGNVRVIVELKELEDFYSKSQIKGMSQSEANALKNAIRQKSISSIEKGKTRYEFSSFNGFSATLTEDDINILISDANVKKIYYDNPVQAFLQDSAQLTNATRTWQTLSNGTNLTGSGETICVIDTGINYTHPDLGACTIRNLSLSGNIVNYTLESEHNYSNNYNNTWKINYTGFTSIALHFVNISLEYQGEFLGLDTNDRIIVYSSNGTELASYHGTNGIIQDIWTPNSDNGTIYVRLVTDAAVTDYGFYIDQIINGTTNTTYNWSSCSKVPFGWDFVNNDPDPYDDNGHGTHVSGIIGANGVAKGIAPDVKIVSAKVLNSAGSGWGSDLMYAIEFCVNNSLKYNISVISMSLGSGSSASYCDNDDIPMSNAVNSAFVKNISVVAATGNSGSTTGIASPACIQNATSVSATDKNDAVASYSNRNNLTDLFAPGSAVNSTTWLCPSGFSSCANGYAVASGTSMAAPHVSAASALLRQFKRLETGRILTPIEIQNALNSTGKRIYDSNTGLNLSRINTYAAVLSLDKTAPATSLISPADNIASGSSNQTFSCNATDLQLKNITLNVWNSTSLYYKNSTSITGTFNLTSFNLTNINAGTYKWNCYSCDAEDNCAYASQNFTLPVSDIALFLLSPQNNLRTNQNQTFSCNASSLNGLTNITFYIWNSTKQAINSSIKSVSGTANTTNLSYNFLQEGAYEWNCLAYDNTSMAKTADSNFTIAYDTTAPSMLLDIQNNSIKNSARFNISLNENASWCGISLNGGANASMTMFNNTYLNYTNTSISEGQHNASFYCNDTAGNLNSTAIVFSIDKTNPSISITYPQNTTYNMSIISLNYTISDANLQACWFSFNNGAANTTITCGTNITGANSSEGSNTWIVSANDSAGNVNFTRLSFIKDTSAPSISLSSPADGTSTTTTGQTFSYSVSDSSSVANCSLILNSAIDQTSSSITKDTTQSFSKTLSVASYTWSINCTDALNNKGSSSARSLTITSSSSSSSSSSNSGSNSGGASATSARTYTLAEQQFKNGHTKELSKNEQFRFGIIKDSVTDYHLAKLTELTNSTAIVEVSSTTQTAVISIGEEKRFDVTDDNYYDLVIKLNGIANNKANLTIKSIYEFINITAANANNAIAINNANNTNASSPITAKTIKEGISKILNYKNVIIILSAIIILAVVVTIIRFTRKWKKRY